MRVLVVAIGEYFHVGAIFRRALVELGHECALVDEGIYFRRTLAQRIVGRLGKGPPRAFTAFNRAIAEAARTVQPEVVIVVKGAQVAPATLETLKCESGATLVNYGTDDPFNPAQATPNLVASVPYYDVFATTKRANIEDLRRAGGTNVVFVPFGFDPGLHFPEAPAQPDEMKRFACDVAFVGSADRERAPMMQLMTRTFGTAFYLYGGLWERDVRLKPNVRGIVLGRDYRLTLGGAKVNLGLVRRANRDGHAMRSFEIPACGAFMLAEQTDEHLELFEPDKHAVFFGCDEELVEKTRYYVAHETERTRIAHAGYERITRGKHTYQDRIKTLLDYANEQR